MKVLEEVNLVLLLRLIVNNIHYRVLLVYRKHDCVSSQCSVQGLNIVNECFTIGYDHGSRSVVNKKMDRFCNSVEGSVATWNNKVNFH
jgi:hypothetical protein